MIRTVLVDSSLFQVLAGRNGRSQYITDFRDCGGCNGRHEYISGCSGRNGDPGLFQVVAVVMVDPILFLFL